ncbi:Spherulation-specific family 4-domain-containing protein [Desarmillaria tabescens]|uniref:Spherulation-specific family 4-domain-containing protein n=1 Tax=Armillaria tabescens TaxID=1929756 RepID=A0AA39MTX8_ARMTA|nr:Spherulation-specific family 4-domain-containing protein [Desarmillaria tabescens]KAK0446073.1 Spherulation-specific family 4-domain-containing protein [Desarmillaria tabescens]
MRSQLSITLFSLLTTAFASTGVLLPLYVYPNDGCNAWEPVFEAITSFPSLLFTVIINPSSGPGTGDSTYDSCISTLKTTGSNVVVVGYVSTSYGNRAQSDVEADVSTYAGWAEAYRPSGIFFDEGSTEASDVSLYQTYASAARSALGNTATVVLNPGTTTDEGYFSFSDLIVTAEDYYSNFAPVILHDAPSPSSLPSGFLSDLTGEGIDAVFITDEDNNNAYSVISSTWLEFCGDLADAQ